MTQRMRIQKERTNGNWHEGVIGIPGKSGKMTAAKYWVKAYDEPSEYGIEEGRISKMTVEINGQTVCNYDRGWDIYPETEEANLAYAILMNEYN